MTGCVFCGIAAGEIPARVLLEGERVLAFRDANPQAPLHVLVIPREHIRDVTSIGPEHAGLMGEMLDAANRVAAGEGVDGVDGGYRLVLNVGPHAGQSVFHLHLHLLGGRPMSWPPG